MNYTLKLLIPVALGLAAAAINYFALAARMQPISYIRVTSDLQVGDVFEASSIEAMPVPPDFGHLDETAIPFSDRGVLLRQRVNRKFGKGDVVFWRDIEVRGPQLDLRTDEDVLLVSTQGSLRPDPSLLRVGSYISFRFSESAREKSTESQIQTVGMFRVVSIGGTVTSAVEGASTRGDPNLIGVAVKKTAAGAEDPKRRQLESLIDAQQLGQMELLQVHLHPDVLDPK